MSMAKYPRFLSDYEDFPHYFSISGVFEVVVETNFLPKGLFRWNTF